MQQNLQRISKIKRTRLFLALSVWASLCLNVFLKNRTAGPCEYNLWLDEMAFVAIRHETPNDLQPDKTMGCW